MIIGKKLKEVHHSLVFLKLGNDKLLMIHFVSVFLSIYYNPGNFSGVCPLKLEAGTIFPSLTN